MGLASEGSTGSAISASPSGCAGVGFSTGFVVFGGGCEDGGGSVVEAGGGGGGTFTRACLGWPQEARNSTAIRTRRSIGVTTKRARAVIAPEFDEATWVALDVVPYSR